VSDAAYRMNQEQIDAFLATPRHAIVAAPRADGTSMLSPIWYVYEKGLLYFSTLVGSAKYRQLRRDPRIAICVDGGHPDARFVTIYGTAKLIEKESPWRNDLEWRVTRRYHESDEAAREYEAQTADAGPSALFEVTPERIGGWDYN
jgi:PPOX class probable F420-dependent enzyme